MIDINELRRLTQEAKPGPWKACRSHECFEGPYFEIDLEDEADYATRPLTRIEARSGVVAQAHDLFEFDKDDANFIAAANPSAISELLDRLEAAEKDIALTERIIDSLGSELNAVANERDELRAKIQMALVVLDEVCGNINPERGYADELETDVKRAIAALSLYNAKGE